MSLDLHQTDDFILNYIFSKLNDNREDLYNFIIILKYANIDCSTLEKINNIESKIYSAYDAMFIQYVLYENTKKILENIINEMISKDIDIQTSDDLWVTINLDQLYNIKLEHIVLTDENIKKILPRTKDLNISKKL
jgi:hypothetical protein